MCVRASVVCGALSMNGKIRQDVFLYERRIRWIFFFQGGKNLCLYVELLCTDVQTDGEEGEVGEVGGLWLCSRGGGALSS